MTLLNRSKALLKHSKDQVLSDASLVKELTEIFRFRGADICSACPGVLSSKFDELKRIVQSGKFNNIFDMAKNKKSNDQVSMKPRRYMLPEGKSYRPFGLGTILTNENLTDEIVEKLIAKNPNVKKVFIDLNEQKKNSSEDSKSDKATLAELKAKYKELSGEDVPDNFSEEELIELLKELENK